MDTGSWASTADLNLRGIERIPDAGIPIGNGKMGSLVWFSSRELHMQINRCDLFANDSTSMSFPVSDTDFSASCGRLDIDFGENVFGPDTVQHLSAYDGVLKVCAGDITLWLRAVMDQDAFLMKIRDERKGAHDIEVCLRTMREGCPYIPGKRAFQVDHPALHPDRKDTYCVNGAHMSKSTLRLGTDSLVLMQSFDEEPYHAQSVMEVVSVNAACETWFRNDNESRMKFARPVEEIRLCIASGLNEVDYRGEDFDRHAQQSADWWHEFWKRAPKMRTYGNADADTVCANLAYFLYIMACTSRGPYMPRYGGLLFYTGGDYRLWGAEFWWHNQQTYYHALTNLGADELTDSMFRQFWNNRENYAACAREQWGTKGIFIPETCWFDGPSPLEEEIAVEMRELYTNKKPWNERSSRFEAYASHKNVFESRWNWQCGANRMLPSAPYCYVNHIFSSTAKVAYMYWLRYRISGDEQWLRDRAYPMLRDCAEMYRNLPFLDRDEAGTIHIRRVNNHENLWDSDDTISELAGMHGVLPLAIRASEVLNVDPELRTEWKEMRAHLAPILTNRAPDALPDEEEVKRVLGEDIPEAWHSGADHSQKGLAEFYHNVDPINLYEIVAAKDERICNLAKSTYQLSKKVHLADGLLPKALDPFTAAIGKMNDSELLKEYLPMLLREIGAQHGCEPQAAANSNVLDNRLDLREGPNCPAAQRLGESSLSMQFALCQLVPDENGGDTVLHLFEGLPDGWNAEIELPAGDGWRVFAEKRDGRVTHMTLKPGKHSSIRILNPVTNQEERIVSQNGECVDVI